MFQTLDDRGARVRAFRPTLALMIQFDWTRKGTALPHALGQRALKQCVWHPILIGSMIVWIGLVLGGGFAGLVLAVPMMGPARMPMPVVAVAVLTPLLILSVFYLIQIVTPRIAWQRWVEIVVGAGHCASCGHSLEGLPFEEDGCCTCPECGASWAARR